MSFKISIRCDGGVSLGTGHIIRQLMIAKELKKRANLTVEFFMKDIEEGVKRVEKEGFVVRKFSKTLSLNDEAKFIANFLKKNNTDLLIVDILDTSKEYISTLKETGVKIVSFDDHSEGKYLADLRFNILEFDEEDPSPTLFEGPKYVTLDPVYAVYHLKEKKIRKKANKILITFGGSDPDNLTDKTLKALEIINMELEIDLVIGFAFSYLEELKENLKRTKHKITLYRDISPELMAQLMFENDIGIGAGGLTQYEFLATGLPGIIVCENVPHQYKLAKWFENKGGLKNLGIGRSISEETIAYHVMELLKDPLKREHMSKIGKSLCDGKGLTRTVDKILEILQ